MLYEKREKFNSASRRVGVFFNNLGLTPNQLTLLSLVFAILTFYFLYSKNFLLSAVLLAITSILDVADGAVARLTKSTTVKGSYYDTIADRYTEFIIIAGLFFAVPASLLTGFWVLLYLFGAMMTTYAKSAAKEKELIERELRGGLLERGERMILLFIGLLLAGVDSIYLTYVIVILAVFSNISALQRIARAVNNVQAGNTDKKRR